MKRFRQSSLALVCVHVAVLLAPVAAQELPPVTVRGGQAGPRDIDQALEWMRGDNQALQLIAMASLARATPVEARRDEVAAQLEKMLNGRDRLVAGRSTDALIVWGTVKQVPSLIKTAHTDGFVFTRQGALDALAPLKDDRIAPALVKALDDPSLPLRKRVLELLGDRKDPKSIPAIARFLGEKFEREAAARALIGMGPEVEAEVRKHLTSSDEGTRAEATRILRLVGKAEKDDEFVAAVSGLQDANVFGRKKSLEFFKKSDPDHPRRAEAAKVLARAAESETFNKADYIKTLSRWAGKDEVPVLLDAMKDRFAAMAARESIYKAVCRLRDERALPMLGARLAAPNARDADLAADALIEFGVKAEPIALDELENDKSWVAIAACRVLKEVGTEASIKPLETRIAKLDASKKDFVGMGASAKDALKSINKRLGK